jgi:deazaflavin-dependent oxidoreductase (nitroreductase family)
MVYVVSAVRRTLRRWVIRGLSRTHLTVHLVTKGRVLGSVAGMPVLLLTTTGRRSGKARTTPLTFFRDGADLVVIASNGGADRSPDWWLNLQQTPRAVVGIGTDTFVATARAASEQERERLWAVVTETYTGYARYQERTSRRIPVVLLTPEGPPVARSTKRG